ncbi:MAG: hypothetical protein ACO1Q7_05990 [Gemmatimonas sp.]
MIPTESTQQHPQHHVGRPRGDHTQTTGQLGHDTLVAELQANRPAFLAASLLLLIALAAGFASLFWPLSWDEGIFAWIGGTVARGGTPYVDAWDVKGPVAYFAYGIAELVFGTAQRGVRVLDLLLSAGGCVAAYRLLCTLVSRSAAVIGALLLLLAILGQGYNVSGQPDLWAGWLAVFAVTVVSRTPTMPPLISAASLLGIAVLIKPIYPVWLLLLWFPVLRNGFTNWSLNIRSAAAMLAGFVLPVALCTVWFWSRGATHEFFDSYITFNLQASGSKERSLADSATHVFDYIARYRELYVALPAVLVALIVPLQSIFPARRSASASEVDRAAIVSHDDRWRLLMIGTWIAIAFALVLLQNRWFGYHWAPLWPPVAIAATVGFSRAWNAFADHRGARTGRMLLALVVLTIAIDVVNVPTRQFARTIRYLSGRGTLEQFESGFTEYPGQFMATDVRLAAEFVKTNTAPDDRVLVWQDPNVNVLSGRQSPGRFSFYTPILAGRNEATVSSNILANRTEFFRSLESHPPKLVLVERSTWLGGTEISIAYLPTQLPALVEWIEANYTPLPDVGAFHVFARR